MTTTPTPTSAERLKALIDRHSLTQRELAKLLQTVPATVSRVLITSPKLHPGPRARLEKAEAMTDAEVLEAIGPRSKRVLKTADPEKGLAVSVHFSKVELDLVNQASEQSGATRSDLIRDASVAHSIRILSGRK